MLISCKIQNYKSFKTSAILNLEALNTLQDYDYYFSFKNKTNVLPVISIFGENNSGKNDIIRFFKDLHQKLYYHWNYTPHSSHLDNSSSEIKFIKDNQYYRYSISLENNGDIKKELLYKNNTLLFKRNQDTVYIKNNNNPLNALYFDEKTPLLCYFDFDPTLTEDKSLKRDIKNVYKFFCEDLVVYEDYIYFNEIEEEDYTYTIDENFEKNKLETLNHNIDKVLKNGSVLFVNTLERDLHPLTVENIINKFLNKETNKNNAQLIFTTHNVDILARQLLRKDQIYFVDKYKKDDVSDLYSLIDFKNRYQCDNYYLAYMQGKFGAIPNNI